MLEVKEIIREFYESILSGFSDSCEDLGTVSEYLSIIFLSFLDAFLFETVLFFIFASVKMFSLKLYFAFAVLGVEVTLIALMFYFVRQYCILTNIQRKEDNSEVCEIELDDFSE